MAPSRSTGRIRSSARIRRPEAVQKLAEANFLPPTRMEIGFTPVVVNTGSQLVLFDSGNSPERRPNAGNLVATMQAAGLDPAQIDVVVITHMHPDHIGGLMADGAPAYPNARYVTGEVEYDFWSKEERLSGPTEPPPSWSRRTSCRSPSRSPSSGTRARSCRASAA